MANEPLERILVIVQSAIEEIERPESRLSSVVQKAIRIARLRNDFDNLWWLQLEMIPFTSRSRVAEIENEIQPHYTTEELKERKAEIAKAYLRDRSSTIIAATEDDKVHIGSLPDIEDAIDELESAIERAKPPSGLHSLDLYYRDQQYTKVSVEYSKQISAYKSIVNRIRNRVHRFLSATEQQLIYGQLNSDVFEQNRIFVDSQLHHIAPDVLLQFNSAYRRLRDDDPEARSQALTSCRRILKSLADKVYPPPAEPVRGYDGKMRKLTDAQYVSRLWQYAYERVGSKTSGKLLLEQVNDLGKRIEALNKLASKGVHASVDKYEVNQCMMQLYITVGDILRITQNDSAI